jgi:hypothetical protein
MYSIKEAQSLYWQGENSFNPSFLKRCKNYHKTDCCWKNCARLYLIYPFKKVMFFEKFIEKMKCQIWPSF